MFPPIHDAKVRCRTGRLMIMRQGGDICPGGCGVSGVEATLSMDASKDVGGHVRESTLMISSSFLPPGPLGRNSRLAVLSVTFAVLSRCNIILMSISALPASLSLSLRTPHVILPSLLRPSRCWYHDLGSVGWLTFFQPPLRQVMVDVLTLSSSWPRQ